MFAILAQAQATGRLRRPGEKRTRVVEAAASTTLVRGGMGREFLYTEEEILLDYARSRWNGAAEALLLLVLPVLIVWQAFSSLPWFH